MHNLSHYINCFSSLHTMKKLGKPAPHKALLLLSVIDLVERGYITDCRVPLSDALIQQFKSNTARLLGESIIFQPKNGYPITIWARSLFGSWFLQMVDKCRELAIIQ